MSGCNVVHKPENGHCSDDKHMSGLDSLHQVRRVQLLAEDEDRWVIDVLSFTVDRNGVVYGHG